MRLVLASSSPRRQELLRRLGIAFEAEPSRWEERRPHAGEVAERYTLELARAKVREVAGRAGDAVVVGGDTAVSLGQVILGKPADVTDAARMLRLLRGRTHEVTTAMVVAFEGIETEGTVTAEVTMREYGDDEIEAYIGSGEPMDKAGGYAVQGEGGRMVQRVVGCYTTVVGMPLCLTYDLLVKCGLSPIRPHGGWCSWCPDAKCSTTCAQVTQFSPQPVEPRE